MDFGEVLGKAWKIIWKHKVLWIFGIFAGCSRGGGGGGGGTGWQQSVQPDQSLPSDALSGVQQFFEGLGEWIGNNPWIVALIILLVLVLIALAAFLGTVGKIGLIRGTFKADEGAERLSFGELFRESLPFFWRVFLLSFLIGVAFLLVLLPMILIGVGTAGVGFLCLAPLFCLLVPLMWAIGIVVQQANAAMVIENLGMVDGVRRGWEVARKNIGPVLLIWFITAVIGVAVGVVLALPIMLMVIPAGLAIAAANGDVSTGVLAVGGLCLALYLPVLVVAQGILSSYIESVWALTFLRLTRPTESRGSAAALPANA